MNFQVINNAAGRVCPPGYGYGPQSFNRAADFAADTLYVIGGLYGNPQALTALQQLAAREAQIQSAPRLIFNGDFHWFDIDPDVFAAINRSVMAHSALRGNVETELAGDDDSHGCGCAYPADVSDHEVEYSNQIIQRLRASARQSSVDRQGLRRLPMQLVARVGAAQVGIAHGDADSLAGWRFGVDQLDDPTQRAALLESLRLAQVDVFASSHTCLPALREFAIDQRRCVIINNGAAGMPNFSATQFGVISRIATTPTPAALPLLHETCLQLERGPVFIAALALHYDHAAWLARFEADWPAGSAARLSYARRIAHGPAYRLQQAYR